MGMNKLFCGIAAVSLIAGAAMAEPQKSNAPVKSIQLSDKQMDKVNAGFIFREIEISDTSVTTISVGGPQPAVAGLITVGTGGAAPVCGACYLGLVSPNMTIFSAMGPTGH